MILAISSAVQHGLGVVSLLEEHLHRQDIEGKPKSTGPAGELILHHLAPEQLKTSPIRALLDYHLEREYEKHKVDQNRRTKRPTNSSLAPLADCTFAMRDPTGFGRSRARAARHLFRMRDKHDIPGRFERLDLMAQTDRAQHWDMHWGRREGETNAERLERLGDELLRDVRRQSGGDADVVAVHVRRRGAAQSGEVGDWIV